MGEGVCHIADQKCHQPIFKYLFYPIGYSCERTSFLPANYSLPSATKSEVMFNYCPPCMKWDSLWLAYGILYCIGVRRVFGSCYSLWSEVYISENRMCEVLIAIFTSCVPLIVLFYVFQLILRVQYLLKWLPNSVCDCDTAQEQKLCWIQTFGLRLDWGETEASLELFEFTFTIYTCNYATLIVILTLCAQTLFSRWGSMSNIWIN